MQAEVRGKGLHVTAVLSTYIQRRLGFALGRFDRRVERVLVRIEDVNGPKGGIDKHCRVVVVMPHSTTAVMEVCHLKSARAEERYIALEEAADLLGAAIARGELDGESASRWMIALFTAVAAIGDGIPRVSASPFACDC